MLTNVLDLDLALLLYLIKYIFVPIYCSHLPRICYGAHWPLLKDINSGPIVGNHSRDGPRGRRGSASFLLGCPENVGTKATKSWPGSASQKNLMPGGPTISRFVYL